MSAKKKITFISGTRADYGKIKPLISSVYRNVNFEVSIIVTGMHLSKPHGYTYYQIKKDFPKINIFKFINYQESMDKILAVTILGINLIIKKDRPDLIVAHGDRPEALSSAIVGHLNNILVCHIEGGEISGTVDESIRHATSKLAHTHFVSNLKAKKILVQLGEIKKNIFVIGSPEVDVMLSNKLPAISEVKKKYEIYFDNYSIVCMHPDLNEDKKSLSNNINKLVTSLIKSDAKYIIIYPNNDTNSYLILNEYKRLKNNKNFKLIPSMRFEYYLTLLKNADSIIGNSSSGIREAPVYKVKTINIGNRQRMRSNNPLIVNLKSYSIPKNMLKIINKQFDYKSRFTKLFGRGKSGIKFLQSISQKSFWNIKKDKKFNINVSIEK